MVGFIAVPASDPGKRSGAAADEAEHAEAADEGDGGGGFRDDGHGDGLDGDVGVGTGGAGAIWGIGREGIVESQQVLGAVRLEIEGEENRGFPIDEGLGGEQDGCGAIEGGDERALAIETGNPDAHPVNIRRITGDAEAETRACGIECGIESRAELRGGERRGADAVRVGEKSGAEGAASLDVSAPAFHSCERADVACGAGGEGRPEGIGGSPRRRGTGGALDIPGGPVYRSSGRQIDGGSRSQVSRSGIH